jgi:PmbA protein
MESHYFINIINKIISQCKYYAYITLIEEKEDLLRFSNSVVEQNINITRLCINVKLYKDKKTIEANINTLNLEYIYQTIKKLENLIDEMPSTNEYIPFIEGETIISIDKASHTTICKYTNKEKNRILNNGFKVVDEACKTFGVLSTIYRRLIIGCSNHKIRCSSYNNVEFKVTVMNDNGLSVFSQYIGDGQDIDFIELFKEASTNICNYNNTISLEPKEYAVILSPVAVGSLMKQLSDIGFNSRNFHEENVFTSGKMNQKIFSSMITISDNVDFEGMCGFGIDLEGNVKKNLEVVNKGILKNIAYDNMTAKKYNKMSTAHGNNLQSLGGHLSNIVIHRGDDHISNIISQSDNVILITRLHYLNIVDKSNAIVTGITRDGTYLIKNGKIVSAIKDMRFTQNLAEAFNDVAVISKERKMVSAYDGSSYVPYIKINHFKFTSVK